MSSALNLRMVNAHRTRGLSSALFCWINEREIQETYTMYTFTQLTSTYHKRITAAALGGKMRLFKINLAVLM